MTCKNGNIFEGECGKLDGKGKFIYKNKLKYEGDFKDGK